jgi:hypothetical protein
MDGDKTVTANFTEIPPEYTLTVNIVGNGSVTLDPASGPYVAGTEVELTAVAATDWEFSGWSGDLSGDMNPTTITMDSDKMVTATFTIVTGDVTISKTQDVGGTVAPGDIFSYSITVQNQFETAVELMVSDALSAYVDYVAGSLEIYEGGTQMVVDEDLVFPDDELSYFTNTLDYLELLTISFKVKVEDLVELGSIITNQAFVSVFYPGENLPFLVKPSNIVQTEVIPEPSTLFFLSAGLFGILVFVRRRRRQKK